MRTALLLSLVLMPGCSFLFTTSPPDTVTAYTTLNCTTSRAAPGVDAALAALSGAGTIVENVNGYPEEYIAAGAIWTVIYATSAIYGFSVTNSCNEATARRDKLVEQLDQRRHQERPTVAVPPPQPGPDTPLGWTY
jgi:hypothetical protein